MAYVPFGDILACMHTDKYDMHVHWWYSLMLSTAQWLLVSCLVITSQVSTAQYGILPVLTYSHMSSIAQWWYPRICYTPICLYSSGMAYFPFGDIPHGMYPARWREPCQFGISSHVDHISVFPRRLVIYSYVVHRGQLSDGIFAFGDICSQHVSSSVMVAMSVWYILTCWPHLGVGSTSVGDTLIIYP